MINKLEKKFGKFAIRNLMYYIIILYAVGFVVQVFGGDFYMRYLSLDPSAIIHGQVWRIVTWIIDPPSTSIFYMLLGLYLYYSIGKTLEYQWGTFRFNLYFFTGVLLTVIAAFICEFLIGINVATLFGTYYLNFSLFLAFAATYPEMRFMLFFLIPIKAKWLGIIEAVYFGIIIVTGFAGPFLPANVLLALANYGILAIPPYGLANAVMVLVSLGNFLIFFTTMRQMRRFTPKEMARKRVYKQSVEKGQQENARVLSRHKCAICGRTDQDDPNLEFRFCSKCNGRYEYCQEHLFTHTHVQ